MATDSLVLTVQSDNYPTKVEIVKDMFQLSNSKTLLNANNAYLFCTKKRKQVLGMFEPVAPKSSFNIGFIALGPKKDMRTCREERKLRVDSKLLVKKKNESMHW